MLCPCTVAVPTRLMQQPLGPGYTELLASLTPLLDQVTSVTMVMHQMAQVHHMGNYKYRGFPIATFPLTDGCLR